MFSIFIFSFSALDYWLHWLTAAAFFPLASILLLCILNSLALIYPSKKREAGAAGDLDSIGQVLVFVFLFFVVSFFLFAIVGGIGAAIWFTTKSQLLMYTVSWFGLLSFCVLGVWITSLFFERFDVSKHGL